MQELQEKFLKPIAGLSAVLLFLLLLFSILRASIFQGRRTRRSTLFSK